MKKLGFTLGSKIIVIFIAALLLLGALAWGFSKPWRGPWRDQLPKVVWINLRAHLIDVTEHIGMPPTEEKAREVLRDLRLEVLVRENDQTLFSTARDFPPWPDIQDEIQDEVSIRNKRPGSVRAKFGDFIVGRTKGRMFAVVDRDRRQYIFFLPEREGLQAGLRAFSGFAFTIAFLLLIVLGVTNWLLRPMKPLMVGVGEISRGNLDYRISIRSRGEFRRVGEAFNAMAEAVQRQLKSKDQLLMDVSHELRSPLGRIKMAAEMLPANGAIGGGPATEMMTNLRDQIRGDVREMEELVSELLELYRLRDADQKNDPDFVRGSLASSDAINLDSLVREVVGPLLQQKPGIEYRLPTVDVEIEGDARQLKRAIRNIVENALKFSRDQTQPVEITLEKKDGFHEITVRDFGVGMNVEHRSRIFEPFYRADLSRVRETGGFGLGLPLAQAIILAHQGEITCETKLNHGSVFKIRLPMRKST